MYLFFHSKNDSHPFFEGYWIYLTGELAVIHCLSNSFSSRYKNYFLEYSQPSILSTTLCIFLTLKFTAIQFIQRTFFQHISEHQSPWKKLIIKAATWSSSFFAEIIFFRIPGCLDLLLLSNNYFLVTNTFSNQLLFEDKCFSSVATASEELFLQNK